MNPSTRQGPDPKPDVIHAGLPELRVTSALGSWLRRYLLLISFLTFTLLAWGAVYTVDMLDLDLTPIEPGFTQPPTSTP